MNNQELNDYINQRVLEGKSLDEVAQMLRDAGWQDPQFMPAIDALRPQAPQGEQSAIHMDHETIAANAQDYKPPKPKWAMVAAVFAGIILAIGALGAVFALFLSGTESAEVVYEKMIQKNLETDSFQYVVSDEDLGVETTITVQTDFSDLAEPKVQGSIVFISDLSALSGGGGDDSVTMTLDIVSIGDTGYVRTAVDTSQLSQEARDSYSLFGTTPEESIALGFGLELNDGWQEVDLKSVSLFDGSDAFLASRLNSIFYDVVIGNFGDNAGAAATLVMDSDVYGVNFEEAVLEELDGVEHYRYDLDFDPSEMEKLADSMVEELGISERMAEVYEPIAHNYESISIWVNPDNYRISRVVENSDPQTILDYSEYNQSFDISAPN